MLNLAEGYERGDFKFPLNPNHSLILNPQQHFNITLTPFVTRGYPLVKSWGPNSTHGLWLQTSFWRADVSPLCSQSLVTGMQHIWEESGWKLSVAAFKAAVCSLVQRDPSVWRGTAVGSCEQWRLASRWVGKAQVGAQVTARGSCLRGAQGDVAGE